MLFSDAGSTPAASTILEKAGRDQTVFIELFDPCQPFLFDVQRISCFSIALLKFLAINLAAPKLQ